MLPRSNNVPVGGSTRVKIHSLGLAGAGDNTRWRLGTIIPSVYLSVLPERRREGVSEGRQTDRKGMREANDQAGIQRDIQESRHPGIQIYKQAGEHTHSHTYKHTYMQVSIRANIYGRSHKGKHVFI